MTMTISKEQIVQIAGSVWSSFLGMSLFEPHTPEKATQDGHTASATVHISGAWNGSVILSCSTSLAQKAAAAMFDIAEADLDDGEVADAFGELVNVIGGNLKCLLPEPSQLSLPTVSLGAAHVVTIPGAALLEHVELECDGDVIHIAVWNQRTDRRHNHHTELEGIVR
jgi:chemotaxis protein CheX